MKIKVVDVSTDNTILVNTSFGDFRFLWNGKIPDVGDERNVEIELQDVFLLDKNIFITSINEFNIEIDDGEIWLTGLIESKDSDGYTVVRFSNSIICIELESNNLSIGQFVRLRITDAVLFDQNY